jgi:enoyl-CoA hydratase/carnithine racemase
MTEPNEKAVLLEKRGDVAWITLNRPEKLNSINDEVREQLPQALAQAEADEEVRVIVLQGAGEKAFCAGADVAGFKAVESLVGLRQSRAHAHWISAFERVRKPVIAAVQGYCLGGGLEIALACDIRIAADEARFGFPEVSRGTIPGAGGTQRIARVIGLGRALHLALTAEQIDAQEALRIGLVTVVVPRAQLADTAQALAERIAGHAPLAGLVTKEALHASTDLDLAAGLRLEADLSALLQSTEDRIEAGTAFREKRKPRFKGR